MSGAHVLSLVELFLGEKSSCFPLCEGERCPRPFFHPILKLETLSRTQCKTIQLPRPCCPPHFPATAWWLRPPLPLPSASTIPLVTPGRTRDARTPSVALPRAPGTDPAARCHPQGPPTPCMGAYSRFRTIIRPGYLHRRRPRSSSDLRTRIGYSRRVAVTCIPNERVASTHGQRPKPNFKRPPSHRRQTHATNALSESPH